MSIYKPVITDAGAALMTQAAAGEALTFTRAQLGSGVIAGDIHGQTALMTPVTYTALDVPAVDGDVIQDAVLFTNRVDSGGFLPAFTLNEIGLWARLGSGAETLLAYANAGAEADGIAVAGDALVEFSYLFKIKFSGAVNVTVDAGALNFVTREVLAQEVSKLNATIEAESVRVTKALSTKAGRPELFAATMRAAKWTGDAPPYTQTLLLPTEGIVAIGLTATATEEEIKVCRAARIELVETANSVITAKAMGVKPGIDIKISATQIV